MNAGGATDHDLLARWRAGDGQAGTQLVRRHFESLSRFFRDKAYEHRADLMQRTWLGCVESRDRVPGELPFKVYLLGIARRVLIHHYRAQKRESGTTPTAEHTTPDSMRSPSGTLAIADEEKLLLRALRMLPLDMQLTIELFYWEELRIEEVAHVLEIPPGTVKSRLSRAKGLLKQQMRALDPPESVLESTQGDLERWARSIRRYLDRPEDV